MKSFLFVLLLFPATVFAQKNVELSLSGGVVNNSIMRPFHWSQGVSSIAAVGGLSLSTDVYKGVRVGLSLSAYDMYAGYPNPDYLATNARLLPLMPLELTLVKRMNIGKVTLDMGVVGGMIANKGYFLNSGAYQPVPEWIRSRMWYTLGTTVSVQVPITDNFSLGGEAQIKNVRTSFGSTLMMPVTIRATFRLGK